MRRESGCKIDLPRREILAEHTDEELASIGFTREGFRAFEKSPPNPAASER